MSNNRNIPSDVDQNNNIQNINNNNNQNLKDENGIHNSYGSQQMMNNGYYGNEVYGQKLYNNNNVEWEFLGASVTENTRKGYERHWEEWRTFVREVAGSDDPYLRGCRPTKKAPLQAVFLQERHGIGLRKRGATAVSASIRLQFVRALEP